MDLIIFTTGACNFRCVYCYETFKDRRMDKQVSERIKMLIDRRANELKYLSLRFFGGEPLLSLDTVKDIAAFAKKVCQANHVKKNFQMTTNGYLLNESIFNELVNLGITNYQITLDGPRTIHNRTRKLVNGSGTFDQIWKNLLTIKKSRESFYILIRIHFTPIDYHYLYPLIDDINRHFINDIRFRVGFRVIGRFGSKNDNNIVVINRAKQADIVNLLSKRLANSIPRSRFINPNKSYSCYASLANSYVIRPDSTINKCTVGLDHPLNQVGRLLDDGLLQLDNKLLQLWIKGALLFNEEMSRCPLNYVMQQHNASQL